MMEIHPAFNFLEEVQSINSEETLVVSKMTVSATGSILYGCLAPSGEYRWFLDYELTSKKEETVGFTIISKKHENN